VRFPEIATIASRPADCSVELSFVIARAVPPSERRKVNAAIGDHVDTLLGLGGQSGHRVKLEWEADGAVTFVRVIRDARSLSREELSTIVSVLATHFASHLLLAPLADNLRDDDPHAQDELVEAALDSLRDPESQKGLVGLREEKRVVVYFHPARKKAKGRARS
jgi:hypothetical protein